MRPSSPRNGSDRQLSLFAAPEENPPIRQAIEFYKHSHNWTNRLIAGDSLLVMNSLLEKEGMAGEGAMVYIDPPYGIRYGSIFQPFVNKRDVKDGKDEDLNQEPEMIKAFRDTWELGIHSYLTYLRDRLLWRGSVLAPKSTGHVRPDFVRVLTGIRQPLQPQAPRLMANARLQSFFSISPWRLLPKLATWVTPRFVHARTHRPASADHVVPMGPTPDAA